jgi:hypothetical protein
LGIRTRIVDNIKHDKNRQSEREHASRPTG